jgi:hypothetical protein
VGVEWRCSWCVVQKKTKLVVGGFALLSDEDARRVEGTTRCLKCDEERRRLEKSVRKSKRNAGLARRRLAERVE